MADDFPLAMAFHKGFITFLKSLDPAFFSSILKALQQMLPIQQHAKSSFHFDAFLVKVKTAADVPDVKYTELFVKKTAFTIISLAFVLVIGYFRCDGGSNGTL